jgi:hypothetical protein
MICTIIVQQQPKLCFCGLTHNRVKGAAAASCFLEAIIKFRDCAGRICEQVVLTASGVLPETHLPAAEILLHKVILRWLLVYTTCANLNHVHI